MDRKKKNKIEGVALKTLSFLGFMLCGAAVGMMRGESAVESDSALSLLALFFDLALLFVAYFINVCLHEVGHMIFGLLTGYQFCSIRFGKMIIVRSNGRLRVKKFALPGTGGQALMLPPPDDPCDFPVFWYNAGGVIMNLATCALTALACAHIPGDMVSCKNFVLSLCLTAAMGFIINSLPLFSIGTDGANIITLRKDRNARVAFRNSLLLLKYFSDNVPYQSMPGSLFAYDREMKLTNDLVTSQAITSFSRLIIDKQFEEAYDLGQYILENAEVINQMQELIVRMELIYILLVHKKARDEAIRAYRAGEKQFKRIASLMSCKRCMYAYYKLAEPDEKKAAACLKAFDAIAKRYPYPEDVRAERALLSHVDPCE